MKTTLSENIKNVLNVAITSGEAEQYIAEYEKQIVHAEECIAYIKNRYKGANIHAGNMLMYAVDATKHPEPWRLWEFLEEGKSGWKPLIGHPAWLTNTKYRHKQ